MRRSTTLRWLIAALALAMLATACGSSGRSGGTNAAAPTETTVPANQMFGDLASPCRPGNGGPATEQGVTADSVTIGYGDDAGYPGAPGLNHQMSDAVKAMIDWCNQQGGINGRKVVGNYYDAKITDVNNVMTEACKQVFMLVGEGFALAGGGEQTRLACGLPAVPGLVGGADLGMAPLMVSPIPYPIDYNSIQNAAAIAKAYPDAVKKAAVFYPNLPASVESTQKVLGTYPTQGWKFLDCAQQYSISGEADWKPFVQKLKDCGAEVVYFSGGNPNFENVLDAAHQLDFHPKWVTESNFYDPQFAAWNTNGNADQVYVRYIFIPLDQAQPGSATQKYLDLLKASGGDTSSLGEQATSAFLLWATAADQCGAQLTRVLRDGQARPGPRLDRRRSARRPGPGRQHARRLRHGPEAGRHQVRPVGARTRPTSSPAIPATWSGSTRRADAEATLKLDGNRKAQKNVS